MSVTTASSAAQSRSTSPAHSSVAHAHANTTREVIVRDAKKIKADAVHCIDYVKSEWNKLGERAQTILKTDSKKTIVWLRQKYAELKSEGIKVNHEIHEEVVGIWHKFEPEFKQALRKAWNELQHLWDDVRAAVRNMEVAASDIESINDHDPADQLSD